MAIVSEMIPVHIKNVSQYLYMTDRQTDGQTPTTYLYRPVQDCQMTPWNVNYHHSVTLQTDPLEPVDI